MGTLRSQLEEAVKHSEGGAQIAIFDDDLAGELRRSALKLLQAATEKDDVAALELAITRAAAVASAGAPFSAAQCSGVRSSRSSVSFTLARKGPPLGASVTFPGATNCPRPLC